MDTETSDKYIEYENMVTYEYERLAEKIRELEQEQFHIVSENKTLRDKLTKLEDELRRMHEPPLIVGKIKEVVDDEHAIIKSSAGPDFIVTFSRFINKKDLLPGVRVALNQRSLAIIKILTDEKNPIVSAMEVIEKPEVSYRDVGGLDEQIREVKEMVELPLKKPELFKDVGIKPLKGILFSGEPGTGKTLLAKAVANETHATFIKINGAELVQKYIGEGARLVREVFKFAKERAPSIIFFDELDAIAARRLSDGSGADREVQRTLMQLLDGLDGFNSYSNVGVIAATNRQDILDPAILRPGRFDRIIKFPLPSESARHRILKIHTRNMSLQSIDLDMIVKETKDCSGAILKAIATEAGMFAIRKNRKHVVTKDFEDAIKKSIPSIRDSKKRIKIYG